MRRASALLLAVSVLLPTLLAGENRAVHAADEVVALEFPVRQADGRLVHLHFSVRAANDAEARQAAEAALPSILPGATLAVPGAGEVAAQYVPWGWRWNSAEIPVRVAYNPANAAPGAGPDAFAGALQSWSEVPASRFAFANAGFTERPPSLHGAGTDGENTVAWARMDCTLGCVLGVTARDDVLHEADIILNNNPQAGLGDGSNGTIDTRTVALHELGHVAGLGHSCANSLRCTRAEEEAAMYYHYAGIRRTLRDDDIAGVVALYPRGAEPPPTPPVLPQEPGPVPVIDVSLLPGWNLVVLPAGPIETFIGDLPCAAAVYGWRPEGWAVWLRDGAPALQARLTGGDGRPYWVLAGGPCSAAFR